MKQSGLGRAPGAENKQHQKTATNRDINRRKVHKDFQRPPLSGKSSVRKEARTVQLDWGINKKTIKIDQFKIEEISQLIKIVARQLTNMQRYKNSGGTIELKISVKTKQNKDFMWAINSWHEIDQLRKNLSNNSITMTQIYLILQKSDLDSVITVFEKNADGRA